MSKTSAGVAADGHSSTWGGAISADGRFVAFSSNADNLGGNPLYQNVFVHDRSTGRTRLVSKTSAGVPANGSSSDGVAISADGRIVAFETAAPNLSPTGDRHVFVHDRMTGRTRLVSKTSAGVPANGHSQAPALSADGRFVAFDSEATNLGGDPSFQNVFVHDRTTGRTRLASKTSAGGPADGGSTNPSLSAGGRFVVFSSGADNLGGDPSNQNVFVHDRTTGRTRLVSKTSAGVPANGSSSVYQSSISADGRFVVFESSATNLGGDPTVGDVFVHDRLRGRTRLVSRTSSGVPATGGYSETARISPDGSFVAFESTATNLPGDPSHLEVFLRDLRRGRTVLVSRRSSGGWADGSSFYAAVSRDGRFVAFTSQADNLSMVDDDSVSNVFVRGPFG